MKIAEKLSDIVCPSCHGNLEAQKKELICISCQKGFRLSEEIPDFRDKDEYWCNVKKEKMRELIKKTRETNDWFSSAKALIPQYAPHFDTFERADSQFLWPTHSDSRVLDAGCMWGGITIPIAQFHKEIYAVDKTLETLSFLSLRAKQMGFSNIFPIACPLRRLPFRDGYFDLVVLSGVLEWVALDQDVILEEHWGKKRNDSYTHNNDPRDLQVSVLRELKRVLKPGGSLYLAIENSIGYHYLLGFPDDHVNLSFVSFLPRKFANFITKWKLNLEYRTYVYTIPGYRNLLQDSGFEISETYAVFHHYINARYIVPFDLLASLKGKILTSSGRKARLFFGLLPKKFIKYFSPSLAIVATKQSAVFRVEARVVRLLKECGLIDQEATNIKAVKAESRSGDQLSVHYWIYDGQKKEPRFFCKVCRSKQRTEAVAAEAKNLKVAWEILQKSSLLAQIPKLHFFGVVDGVTLMVTNFLKGDRPRFTLGGPLKELIAHGLHQRTRQALSFLTRFQQATCSGKIKCSVYLNALMENLTDNTFSWPLLNPDVQDVMNRLRLTIQKCGGFNIPLVAVHGDFDFFYNIFFDGDVVRLLDFEHFERQGLPFLDLGSLLFSPILTSRNYEKDDISFTDLLNHFDMYKELSRRVSEYSNWMGIPKELLELLGPLAALESRIRNYPCFRDPGTFPLRRKRTFQDLTRLRLIV